jgi:LacI family transcriptional regulator
MTSRKRGSPTALARDGRIPAAAAADNDKSRRRTTINDIARLAHVSKKTVSRVINQSPYVREETRNKINSIINELGFEPDPQARGLAFRRSFLIGLVYDNPNAQYIVNVQGGMLDAMRGSGYELVVHPCDRTSKSFLTDVRGFVERQKLYGVVLLPPVSENDEVAQLLRALDCPYVRIASTPLDQPGKLIVYHDQKAAAEAAEHLVSLGHTRIGFIAGPASYRSAHERRLGFTQGLARHQLKLAPDLVTEGEYSFESGVKCANELLSRKPRPTAIFASNDEMAAGVYKAANARGLKIPEDLSVVGFDDSPLATRVWPPLTTVHLPIRDMGKMAAQKLISQNANGAEEVAGEVEPRLVIRESSARIR